MKEAPQPAGSENLRSQLEILRQMVLLALGANHPTYRSIDQAFLSGNKDRMQRAIEDFEQLPDEDKNYALGLDHMQDDLTGTD
jgi:hypothetical protein